jgi:hypothetical protein
LEDEAIFDKARLGGYGIPFATVEFESMYIYGFVANPRHTTPLSMAVTSSL